MELRGKSLVPGSASGKVLYSNTALSIWGGVDSQTGVIIDEHHPLRGRSLSGSVFALPSGRGSCTGSMVLLELLLCGNAPAALILAHQDEILALGVIVANILFDVSIPIVVLPTSDFLRLHDIDRVSIHDSEITTVLPFINASNQQQKASLHPPVSDMKLSVADRSILAGEQGAAAKLALEIILCFSAVQGATELLHVSRSHIDSCIYTGPASLRFAQKLLSLDAKVAVPTTMNSISIDSRRWRELGMDPKLSAQAEKLARAYVSMGAQSTFTCAPYGLPNPPKLGDHLGWGESNAVIFANSVLGARTQKYPDLLDVCIALTGRAPLAGCHQDEGRRPAVQLRAPYLAEYHDSSYAALGYLVGSAAQNRIPLVYGLEHLKPTIAELKAFSAAFGTTSSAAMFHIVGITPEASEFVGVTQSIPELVLDEGSLNASIDSLNTAKDPSVGVVSLGNPHFLLEEFQVVAKLCENRKKCDAVSMIITTNQATYKDAVAAGFMLPIEAFGASVITDTCWCMISEPVIGLHVRNIMTNSAKYAHYAPGMCRRGVHFGSLAQCVEAACLGRFERTRGSGFAPCANGIPEN